MEILSGPRIALQPSDCYTVFPWYLRGVDVESTGIVLGCVLSLSVWKYETCPYTVERCIPRFCTKAPDRTLQLIKLDWTDKPLFQGCREVTAHDLFT